MRAYAQKGQGSRRSITSLVSQWSSSVVRGHEARMTLQRQRTGEYPGPRDQAKPDVPAAVYAPSRSGCLGYDFSPIALRRTTLMKIQPRLTVNIPGDVNEEQADRLSGRMMRMAEPRLHGVCPCGECSTRAPCQGFTQLHPQRVRAHDAGHLIAPPIVHEVLSTAGQPLDSVSRDFMGPRFGYDFGHVRVHKDQRAAESAEAVGSRAYTVGLHIVFGAHQCAPGSSAGRALLAHELTHVIQQSGQGFDNSSDVPAGPGFSGRLRRLNPTPSSVLLQRTARGETGIANLPSSGPTSSFPSTSVGGPNALNVFVRQSVRSNAEVDYIWRAAGIAAARESAYLADVADVAGLATALQVLTTGAPRCVRNLVIWNHGSPRGQLLGSRTSRIGLNIDWLTNPATNLDTLNTLRGSLCCGATMKWLGCATAGVFGPGGHRAPGVTEAAPQRYAGAWGDIYRDPEDAARHGGVVFGLGLGRVNVQSWANATCATVEAANEFTFWPSSMPGGFTLWSGGRFILFPPAENASCACVNGHPNIIGQSQYARALSPIQESLEATLRETASDISLPADLPAIRPDAAHFNVQLIGGGGAAAETLFWRLFCEESDPWSWIVFYPGSVRDTRNYTRAVMEHEIQHCGDAHRSLASFRARPGHPTPPTVPPEACSPGFRHAPGTQLDVPFWQYYEEWLAFAQREGLIRSTRHLEIYEQARTRNNFEAWSSRERTEWLGGALVDGMPEAERIPTATLLPIEESVVQRFLAGGDERKSVYVAIFYEAINQLGARCHRAEGSEADATRLWNIYNHFGPIHRWWRAARNAEPNICNESGWQLGWQVAGLCLRATELRQRRESRRPNSSERH
jgi:hypothetical protein